MATLRRLYFGVLGVAAAFSGFSSSEVVVVDIFCLFGSGSSSSGGGGESPAMFMEERSVIENSKTKIAATLYPGKTLGFGLCFG